MYLPDQERGGEGMFDRCNRSSEVELPHPSSPPPPHFFEVLRASSSDAAADERAANDDIADGRWTRTERRRKARKGTLKSRQDADDHPSTNPKRDVESDSTSISLNLG